MRPQPYRVVLFVLVLSLFVQPAARADVTRFDLSGVITDSSGAVLPAVTVTIRNLDTGFSRTATTDAQGRYSFNAVPPTGRWTISAELQGFQTQVREGLEFQANT